MPLNLPIPKTFMQSFMDTRKQQSAEDLQKAQMAQAYGSANKSNMISRLMGEAFGSEGSDQSGTSTSSGNTDRRAKARSILQALGYMKETPAEQEAREMRVAGIKSGTEVSAAAQKETDKANIKRSQELIDAGKLINQYSQHSMALTNLLEKKDVTGNIPALENLANLGGEDVGTFNENATPLVGQLGKELSSRGGAIVSGMAAAAKPQLKKSRDYNIGVLNELHKQTYHSYKAAKEEYERINPGKLYPVKLHSFYDRVKVKSPYGHEKIMSPEDARRMIKKYPGSRVVGLAYGD